MPYTWSINNVVMGETVHTALGYWQAGRPYLDGISYVFIKDELVGSSSFLGW
jgi:hypothetical protein